MAEMICLFLQRSKDLPDGAEVIRGVGGAGECAGGGDVVPIGAGSDGFLPCFAFVAKTAA